MTYLVVSDIHSNYPALESIISEEAGEYESVYVLGDILGLHGFSRDVVELLQELPVEVCLQGNHDVALISYGEGHVNSAELSRFELETTTNQLTQSQQQWIEDRPVMAIEEIETGSVTRNILLAHAKPSYEEASGYNMGNRGIPKREYPTIAAAHSGTYDNLFLGHTHQQAFVDCSNWGHDIQILNPGTVGSNLGTAEYALYDEQTNTVTQKTVTYDPSIVTERLIELDVPSKWWC